MDTSSLQEAYQRLWRLFPSSLAGLGAPGSTPWRDDLPVTAFLEEAIRRSGWTVLAERYAERLKELRKEAAAPFESQKDTLRIQCRAFNEVMDQLDRARREAMARADQRSAGSSRPV